MYVRANSRQRMVWYISKPNTNLLQKLQNKDTKIPYCFQDLVIQSMVNARIYSKPSFSDRIPQTHKWDEISSWSLGFGLHLVMLKAEDLCSTALNIVRLSRIGICLFRNASRQNCLRRLLNLKSAPSLWENESPNK